MSTPRGEQRRPLMSRRGLLGGALTVAVTGLVSALCSDLAQVDRAGASEAETGTPALRPGSWPPATARRTVTGSAAASARTTAATPHSSAPVKPPVVVRHRTKPVEYHSPVFTLHDYVHMTPGARRFPSDSIMLTIDDGPDPEWTPKILRLLEKHHVQATFCMIGCEVKASPKLAKAVVTQGHHLANHTFTHPLSLPGMPLHRIRREIDRTQDAVATATGVAPHLFRSPGGNWGRHIYRELGPHGLVPLDWDIDPRDWARPGTSWIENAMLAAGPGDIILCHDGGGDRSETYAALKRVIPQLRARGLEFVTLPAHGGVASSG
jgi:peptidoglycan/xylan/chitin deacetylase (PgdA/CDA1 family)